MVLLFKIDHAKQFILFIHNRRFLSLAMLAPPIVDAIFAGKAPWTLSLTKLNTTLPYSWKKQMELFGMA